MRVDLNIAAIERGVFRAQQERGPVVFDDLIVVGDLVYLFRDGALLGITGDYIMAEAEA